VGSSNCLASDHEEECYAYACMSENFSEKAPYFMSVYT
jgi:hypothetical protein